MLIAQRRLGRCSNARTYNQEGSVVAQDSLRLLRAFQQRRQELQDEPYRRCVFVCVWCWCQLRVLPALSRVHIATCSH